jgi:hypothetical protein
MPLSPRSPVRLGGVSGESLGAPGLSRLLSPLLPIGERFFFPEDQDGAPRVMTKEGLAMTEYESQSLELQRQSRLLLCHIANGISALLTQPEAGGTGLGAANAQEAHAEVVLAWQRKLSGTIDGFSQAPRPRSTGQSARPG